MTASVDGSWSDHSLESPRRSAILMTDGADASRKALRSLLEEDGYLVVGASGTSEMLEILNKSPTDYFE